MNKSQEIYQSQKKQKFQREKSVEYRGKTYKNAIMFFGENAIDFRQAYKNGIVDNNTNIVCVERDVHIAEKLKAQFPKKYFPNLHIVNNDFCKIDFSEYFGKNSIDYVNFDICGNMTFPIMEAFDCLDELLSNKFRFHATFRAVRRRPGNDLPLIKDIMKYSDSDKNDPNFKFNIWKKNLYKFSIINWLKEYCNKHNTTEENFSWVSKELQESIAYQLSMVANLTHNHWFKIDRFSVYKNSDINNMASYMVSIDCDNVTSKGTLKTDNADFIGYFAPFFRKEQKNYNHVSFILPNVNPKGLIAFSVNMPPIKKGKKIQRNKTGQKNQKLTYRKMLNIKDRKDFDEKRNTESFYDEANKIAQENNTTIEHIFAGIARELTCEENK